MPALLGHPSIALPGRVATRAKLSSCVRTRSAQFAVAAEKTTVAWQKAHYNTAASGKKAMRNTLPVSSTSRGEASGQIALEGDTVTVHFTVFGESGERLESTKDAGQPLTFEVGASEVIGNDLLNAFDGGVRGLSIGIQASSQMFACRPQRIFT